MNIHEYQAKQLFRQYDVPVPKGDIARTPAEARGIAEELDGFPVVLKAQIHAGGRGKSGGVKLAGSAIEVETEADALLNMTLVTPQTGPEGKRVHTVLVEQGVAIRQELYLSLLIDRSTARILFIASAAGGMDIEGASGSSPDAVKKISIDPLTGIQPFHCRQLAFSLGIPTAVSKKFVAILARLYRLFVEYDCSLLEINPLAITETDSIVALDGKIDIDANSLFRHSDIVAMRDRSEEDPMETLASASNLNYIKLSGTVGNMVNGAGLAMATMDLIKQAGAEPANFLDVGGGANVEMIEKGFAIIMADPNVQAVLINIFGGILRCDLLAKGVIQATKKTGIALPVVVRMEGTNVEEGLRLLDQSGLNLIIARDLQDAAEKITGLVGD
jgi:succinyl-CoA synthetase beta subunit